MTERERQVEALWKVYPKKLDKQQALPAIRRALTRVDYETLLKAVTEYSEVVMPYKNDPEKWLGVPYPQKWFNRNRWEAEAMAEARMKFPPPNRTYQGTRGPSPDVLHTYPSDAVDRWIEAGKTPEEAKRMAVKVYK